MVGDNSPSEVAAAALLKQLFERLQAAEVRCDAFTVRPGSLLAEDDRQTAYDPISYQVRFLLVAAFDHMNTFRRTLSDGDGILPTFGAYPLVRASLESAAQVLWLTKGGKRPTRVFRALHRVWDAASLSDEAIRHVDPQMPSRLDRLRRRLDELLGEARVQKSLNQKHPSMTNIVLEAGRYVPSRRVKPIDVWRLCSSMAHGNRSVSLALLERRSASDVTDTGADFLMTSSFSVMAEFVSVVADVVDAALDDRDRLNATTNGRERAQARAQSVEDAATTD